MFIPLLIYILIGVIWNIKHIENTKESFDDHIEKYGKNPSIGDIITSFVVLIVLWLPIEIYILIAVFKIKKHNKDGSN